MVFNKNFTILEEFTNYCSALPGNELGLLRFNPATLNTRHIYGIYMEYIYGIYMESQIYGI